MFVNMCFIILENISVSFFSFSPKICNFCFFLTYKPSYTSLLNSYVHVCDSSYSLLTAAHSRLKPRSHLQPNTLLIVHTSAEFNWKRISGKSWTCTARGSHFTVSCFVVRKNKLDVSRGQLVSDPEFKQIVCV